MGKPRRAVAAVLSHTLKTRLGYECVYLKDLQQLIRTAEWIARARSLRIGLSNDFPPGAQCKYNGLLDGLYAYGKPVKYTIANCRSIRSTCRLSMLRARQNDLVIISSQPYKYEPFCPPLNVSYEANFRIKLLPGLFVYKLNMRTG